MNTENFFSIATEVKDFLIWFTPAVSLFIAFLYVRARAGSAGFLLDRVWRVLGGKKDFHNPIFQSECNQLGDYEKFKYISGIRFQSNAKVIETLAWLQECRIGLEELIRVKSYFSSNEIKLRLPQMNTHKAIGAITIFIFTATTLIALISHVPAALLTIKKTDTIIWASTSTVRSWDGFRWVINADDCRTGKIQLENHDEKVICEILTDSKIEKPIEEAMLSQRIVAILFWIMAGFFMFVAAREFAIAKHAVSLYERVLTHNGKQLRLPL